MTALFILLLCIALMTSEQLLFKASAAEGQIKWPLAFSGVMTHLLYLAAWFTLLRLIPLNLALPSIGMSYVTIALAGRIFFKEKMNLFRWSGIGLILAGFCFIYR